MTYLLLGEDSPAKDRKILQLKEEIFSSSLPGAAARDALAFDYENLDGRDVDALDLQKSLGTLPALNRQRLIVLRSVHKLNTAGKEALLKFIAQKRTDVVVILEAGDTDPGNPFLKSLAGHAKVVQLGVPQKRQNVFDVTNAVAAHNPARACAILNDLFAQGERPVQIMGGLIWFWGKSRPRLSAENFQEGLAMLQEADLNIKRSRLKPEHGLELLIVKLAGLYGV